VDIVPRASTYWKNPERYRKQARAYSKKRYVPRKKKKLTKPPLVFIKSSIKKRKYKDLGRYSNPTNCTDDIDVVRVVLTKYYSRNHISKKLKQMRKLGQVFMCEGFCFMPLSSFLQAQSNKAFTTVADTYRKGEKGVLDFVSITQQCFPARQFFITFTNPVHQKGIDFLVLREGIPYCAIEVTNYERSSFLSTKDVTRYIENLNYWSKRYPDIHKVLVVQYGENLKRNPQWRNVYTEFAKNGIGIKIVQ